MTKQDLDHADLYVDRELSLLEFNRRVIHQSTVESFPLLERLRFLCIASSNLDEFFEIRVAGIKQQIDFGLAELNSETTAPSEQLVAIAELAHELVDSQYEILDKELTPRLRDEGIFFLRREEWSPNQSEWLQRYFREELSPILDPIGLDPAHPFPRLLNKILNFIITMSGTDVFGRHLDMAIVQVPRTLSRVVRLPREISEHPYDFVFLSSIIHAHVAELFQGVEVSDCHQFRVTRNSDLFLNEEEASDLRQAIQGELPARRYGDAVRLEIAHTCPENVVEFLTRQFELTTDDVYRCHGPVNLMRLMQIPDLVNRAKLKFAPFVPGVSKNLQDAASIFTVLRRRDVLLHHPYQSFGPVLDFLRQAATDPKVLSIRQTLYRTGEDSAVVKALIDAATNEKEVLVVIELRARFDEAENIELASELNEAGVQVVYGMVGFKTHAKMLLVTRRETNGLRRYAHLGTGNYHPRTTRQYTDFGLMTSSDEITADVYNVFRQLTSMGHPAHLSRLLQSPFILADTLLDLIEREIEHHRAGREAGIICKVNSLEEKSVIRAFYKASQSGVDIQLIVRGVCCLRPGIPGVSNTITVRSIVGRFLEHERVFHFKNGGDSVTYLSSADLMSRNLFRRVEAGFPVMQKDVKKRVEYEALELYLEDTSQAWEMQPDGTYVKCAQDEKDVNAQLVLLREHSAASNF